MNKSVLRIIMELKGGPRRRMIVLRQPWHKGKHIHRHGAHWHVMQEKGQINVFNCRLSAYRDYFCESLVYPIHPGSRIYVD